METPFNPPNPKANFTPKPLPRRRKKGGVSHTQQYQDEQLEEILELFRNTGFALEAYAPPLPQQMALSTEPAEYTRKKRRTNLDKKLIFLLPSEQSEASEFISDSASQQDIDDKLYDLAGGNGHDSQRDVNDDVHDLTSEDHGSQHNLDKLYDLAGDNDHSSDGGAETSKRREKTAISTCPTLRKLQLRLRAPCSTSLG